MNCYSPGSRIMEKFSKNSAAQQMACGRQLSQEEIAAFPDELFTFDPQEDMAAAGSAPPSDSYWKCTWKAFCKNRLAMFILLLLAALILFTFIQPYLPNQRDPNLINNDSETGLQLINHPPDDEFLFGTNSIGQDLWARLWAGTRTSLLIGLMVTLIRGCIGIIIGILWGYVKWLDVVMTEIYNVLSNIPSIIVFTLVSYILHPGIGTLIFSMCVLDWLSIARFVRIQTVIIREREFNVASRCFQAPFFRIVMKNLLPHMVSAITLQLALTIPSAIAGEVFLTYIGLGLPQELPSLGNLIDVSRTYIVSDHLRYQFIFPAAVLSLITVGFYIVGNAFADASDPKNQQDSQTT